MKTLIKWQRLTHLPRRDLHHERLLGVVLQSQHLPHVSGS